MMVRKDILLDVLSPDNNVLYGSYSNFTPLSHLNTLKASLNVAVLLCGDRCLVPPFFPLQCSVARKALEAQNEYLLEGLVVFPVREAGISDFLAKKEFEYATVRSVYKGVYNKDAARFLKKYANVVVKRQSHVGQDMLPAWQSGPDVSPIWQPIKRRVSGRAIEEIRQLPQILKENGQSITWAGMRRFLSGPIAQAATFEINQALQHEYMQVYLREYDAAIISGLPPKTTDLLLPCENLSYNYGCWRRALSILQLWPAIGTMLPHDIIRIRQLFGYLIFVESFEALCLATERVRDVQLVVAAAYREMRPRMIKRIVDVVGKLKTGQGLTRDAERICDDYLASIAAEMRRWDKAGGDVFLRMGEKEKASMQYLCDAVVITALPEERDAILARLGNHKKLDKDGEDTHTYYRATLKTTRVDGALYEVIVTSLADMGPMMAFGKAQAIVSRWRPKVVLLVGIACGLSGEADHGDVLVGKMVLDYTLGKLHADGRREVRWNAHPAGANLLDAAMNVSGGWDKLISVSRPSGGRPKVVSGLIASGGDVIANDDILAEYKEEWPKLVGIEMEAAGVASGLHNTARHPEFLTVKAVSDFGKDKHDPAVKPWRNYACDAAAAFAISLLTEGVGPSVK